MFDFHKKLTEGQDLGEVLVRGLRESAFLVYVATSLLLLISLMTFNLDDPGWSHGGESKSLANAAGSVGAWLADFFLSLFGITAYSLPFMLAAYGYAIYKNAAADRISPLDTALRWLGLAVALGAATGITDRFMVRPKINLPEGYGGIFGREVADSLAHAFGTTGMTIVLVTLFLAGISLFSGLSWLAVLDAAGHWGLKALDALARLAQRVRQATSEHDADVSTDTAVVRSKTQIQNPAKPATALIRKHAADPVRPTEPEPAAPPCPISIKPRKADTAPTLPAVNAGQLPSLELLNDKAPRIRGYSNVQLEEMSRQLETILDDFGVEVQVMEVHPGPVITRFEVQPAPGVKVSRISGLAKDLARTLSVTSVRVVEIIPGKTVVGLEIPNEEREMVLLHSVLASDAYQNSHSPLTMVLGKDISGNPVVANLARMPHLLVAGTTGSGKSVAVNVMILSMLFKAKPEDVRLIMIDPKMLELSIYEGIPHLLTPVVTDMREAANALRWCVAEMERRYKLMSLMGVRNLAGFNQKISEANEAGEPIPDPTWAPDVTTEHDAAPFLEPLPFIVIVIDELADMMMIVGKKVEELIARLAQKARAAGLHLILATQRPSVDVITGLIKANIPTRIGFQVSSKIDSRTIL
ncbi:MAG: DNA translocase FtsK, partial [Methylococcaceae bacterium]